MGKKVGFKTEDGSRKTNGAVMVGCCWIILLGTVTENLSCSLAVLQSCSLDEC